MSSGDSVTRTLSDDSSAGQPAEVLPTAMQLAAAQADRRLVQIQRAVVIITASLIFLAAVRLWFVEGLLRRVTIDGPSMAPALCGAHYDATCSDCGFSFRCDAEHLPSDRLAACPNCGFTEIRLDAARLAPPDRVLIDRWPLLARDPQRNEVVALQPPGVADLAVKRVAALPAERLSIERGDLLAGGQIVRKTQAELHATRVLVHDNRYAPTNTKGLPPRWRGAEATSQWKAVGAGFQIEPTAVGGDADWLEYEHWPCAADATQRGIASPITDNDGYNQGETRRVLNPVSDVQLSCRLKATGNGRFVLAAVDGNERFECEIRPPEQVVLRSRSRTLVELPLHMNFARHPIEIEFGHCDQQVLLAIEGRTVIRHRYDRPTEPRPEVLHPLAIGAAGLGMQISDLRVWRDIYYLDPAALDRPWEAPASLPEVHFALLGDNQPVSIDSRHWEPPGVPRSAILGRVVLPFWRQTR
jgi:hypothetical protein